MKHTIHHLFSFSFFYREHQHPSVHFPLSSCTFTHRHTHTQCRGIKLKPIWEGGNMWGWTTKMSYFGDQRNKWKQHNLGYNRMNGLLPAGKCYQEEELGRFQWWLIKAAALEFDIRTVFCAISFVIQEKKTSYIHTAIRINEEACVEEDGMHTVSNQAHIFKAEDLLKICLKQSSSHLSKSQLWCRERDNKKHYNSSCSHYLIDTSRLHLQIC